MMKKSLARNRILADLKITPNQATYQRIKHWLYVKMADTDITEAVFSKIKEEASKLAMWETLERK